MTAIDDIATAATVDEIAIRVDIFRKGTVADGSFAAGCRSHSDKLLL